MACSRSATMRGMWLNPARRLIRLSALVAVSERDGDVHLPCCGGYLWWVRRGEKAGERE
jgi:hypothetical protein